MTARDWLPGLLLLAVLIGVPWGVTAVANHVIGATP